MELPEIENVEISELAFSDLDEIWTFISRDSAYYADNTIDELIARVAMLGDNPRAGSLNDDLMAGLRLFPYNDFNIFYFQAGNGVEIYRILHSSRDIVQMFDDSIDEIKDK